MKRPRSPLRLLKERYFGEAARNPWVARNALDRLLPNLPGRTAAIAQQAVPALLDYQDGDYALIYLDRLERFMGANAVEPELLAEIARLMLARMMYDDPIRFAQVKLEEAGPPPFKVDAGAAVRVETFRYDELAGMLPATLAPGVVTMLASSKLMRRKVALRFGYSSYGKLLRLRALAALRIGRPYLARFFKERAWVERWLHMIERARLMQPQAVAAIIASAGMIEGHGDTYADGLANWHALIDRIVKPGCDGTLEQADLGATVRGIVARAMSPNATGADVRTEIVHSAAAAIHRRSAPVR